MKSGLTSLNVPLSHLVPSRRNPRKVKPSQQSHQSLVALIRSYGLLQPLVVRPIEGKAGHYEVVAGHRRLRALREIYRNDGNPTIPCVLRDVDTETADAVSLGENFGREPMHPLDEAEAFARLVCHDGKDAQAIAADFGVGERYVRQRMKLAGLADEVKTAYRAGEINTGTAEAFASVSEDRQMQVWQETAGHPRHAEHVRNVIAHDWIDAVHALFDVSVLPDSAVSRDLFSERVLVERQAFMDAQAPALDTERSKLLDEGWKEVITGRYEDVQDQCRSLDVPQREFDEPTSKKLAKLAERRQKLEEKLEQIGDEDEKAMNSIQEKFDALEAEEQEILAQSPVFYSEATKSTGTAFLMLLPDGQVRREYRIPRQHARSTDRADGQSSDGSSPAAPPPTSDELGERQLAVTFTHQTLVVREALLKNDAARKRVLALILHEKVRSEALAVRHEANGTTLHAEKGEGFTSPAFDRLREMRAKFDPFLKEHFVEELAGYEQIAKLKPAKLDELIELLIVECVTAHLQRPTELVSRLAIELKVKVRDDWKPDAAWLAGFQKIQLSHLITELMGAAYAPAPERKKSELVEVLAKLFADAAEGKLEDKQLAQKVNQWLPSSLRPSSEDTPQQ